MSATIMEVDDDEGMGRDDDEPPSRAEQRRMKARAQAEQRRKVSRAAAELRKRHYLRKHCVCVVDVEFKTNISPSLVQTVSSFVLEYLLFVRGQIPSLLPELRKITTSVPEEGSRPRGNALRDQRRVQRLLTSVDGFQQTLDALSSRCEVSGALFVLGQSLASAKEVYFIRFHLRTQTGPTMDAALSDHQKTLVQKKIARTFVQSARLPQDCQPKTRLLVLLQCRGLDAGATGCALPSEVTLRPAFCLGDMQVRGDIPALHIIDCRNPDEAPTGDPNSALDAEPDASWLAFLPRIVAL